MQSPAFPATNEFLTIENTDMRKRKVRSGFRWVLLTPIIPVVLMGGFDVVAVVTDIAADGTMRGQCFSSECEHENACDTFEGGILSIEFQDAQPLRQLQWTVFHDG